MNYYHLAGHDFYIPHAVTELAAYRRETAREARPYSVRPAAELVCRAVGLVGGTERAVEVWSASPGILLRVAGGSDFYIESGGRAILRADGDEPGEASALTDLDREILAGPALVMALAQRGTWSLHASAAAFGDCTFAFLGESGQGKSTLAAYLADAGHPHWQLVADDILPVRAAADGAETWPHFPQLKLSDEAQPGPNLPEHLPLDRVCILTSVDPEQSPALRLLPPGEAIQGLLRHTAGTRLFSPDLLAGHLAFCSQIAGQVRVYRLLYPARRDILPHVKELLENLC